MNAMTENMVYDIKQIKLEKYIKFTEYLADYLYKYPQVVAIYQMGGWTQPGISDIDLIIVVKELKKSDYEELNVMSRVLARNSEEEYMLMHAPFVISEKAFKHLDLFFYCSDLKKLRGKEIKINENPVELQEIAELYKLVSVLVHTYPRFYFLNKKKWSLRSFLTFGYSLKHTYRIIRQFDNSFQNNEIEEYIEKMTDLRKQVIETRNVNEKVIFPLIELGINVSKIMLQKVDNIIVERIPFQPGKTDFMYIKSFEIILSFVTGSNSFELSKNEGVNILKLPHSYAIFILMPSGNGGLSSYQSKRIVGENSINLNEEKKELLELIEKPFAEYNSLFKNCKVFNGMSFELNTPYIWNTRKYNPSNLLDYARWFKHMVLNKKNEIKVSKIINTHNY